MSEIQGTNTTGGTPLASNGKGNGIAAAQPGLDISAPTNKIEGGGLAYKTASSEDATPQSHNTDNTDGKIPPPPPPPPPMQQQPTRASNTNVSGKQNAQKSSKFALESDDTLDDKFFRMGLILLRTKHKDKLNAVTHTTTRRPQGPATKSHEEIINEQQRKISQCLNEIHKNCDNIKRQIGVDEFRKNLAQLAKIKGEIKALDAQRDSLYEVFEDKLSDCALCQEQHKQLLAEYDGLIETDGSPISPEKQKRIEALEKNLAAKKQEAHTKTSALNEAEGKYTDCNKRVNSKNADFDKTKSQLDANGLIKLYLGNVQSYVQRIMECDTKIRKTIEGNKKTLQAEKIKAEKALQSTADPSIKAEAEANLQNIESKLAQLEQYKQQLNKAVGKLTSRPEADKSYGGEIAKRISPTAPTTEEEVEQLKANLTAIEELINTPRPDDVLPPAKKARPHPAQPKPKASPSDVDSSSSRPEKNKREISETRTVATKPLQQSGQPNKLTKQNVQSAAENGPEESTDADTVSQHSRAQQKQNFQSKTTTALKSSVASSVATAAAISAIMLSAPISAAPITLLAGVTAFGVAYKTTYSAASKLVGWWRGQ